MDKLIVSNAPFMHSGNDVNKMFLYVAIALLIPATYGVTFFGMSALFVILTSVACCFVFEALYNLLFKKKLGVDDFSCVVTGLILALTMPHTVSLWVVGLSAFFAEVVVKLAFGGLGRNKFNPSNTARCFAGVVVAGLSGSLYEIVLNGEKAVSLTAGGVNTIYNLLIGQSVGGIGTPCCLVIVLCYVFLVYTGVIDFKLPILAVVAYFVTSLTMTSLNWSLMNMCSGSFLFVSVFCLTDPNTSPDTFIGKFVYSVLFGVLSAIVWQMGALGENSVFVVLLFVNLFVPMMDRYFVWKPNSLGGYRYAHKN